MERNSHYSLFSNIKYALNNIWKWDKMFYFYFIPSIPLAIILPLAGIYFPKLIIDAIQEKQSIKQIIATIAIYFISLFFINQVNRFCASRLGMRNYSFSTLYQHKITEKFMRTDFCNTDNPKLNILYTQAMNDACSGQCAPEHIWISLSRFLTNILGIITYGAIITYISPILLVLLILSAFVTYFTSRWIQKYSQKNKDKKAEIDRKIGYISGFSSKFEFAKDIRIYNMLNWLNSLLVGFQKERYAWVKRESLRTFYGESIDALLALLRDGFAYVVLITMLINNRIGVGDFVFLFGAITGFSIWLLCIVYDISDLIDKGIKISYYRDYFNIKENYNHNQGCELPAKSEFPLDIEFCNVSYKYPSSDEDKYALKNINLRIKKGERIAIVGHNGAGKTTLVKLLCGLYIPTEGTIKVNGVSIAKYNIEDYYTLFSVVFQDIYLLPITIAEFISSSDMNIDYEKVTKVLVDAGLNDKIRSLSNGLNSRIMKGIF